MINYLKQHKKIFISSLLLTIFLFSFSVHYSLYKYKGFVQTQYYALLLARNWAETGQLSYESEENISLSTESIQSKGVPTNLGNKLIYFIYGSMFRIFGFHPELPMYISFILSSLAAIFIFLTAYKIFNLKTGLLAAILINIAPFSLIQSHIVGFHEWAWFFLTLATFFYFWPKQRKARYLILTGIFLGLSAASKNSFFVTFPAFVILEFWQEKNHLKVAAKKVILLSVGFISLFVPLTFIGGNIYINSIFGVPNSYHESFTMFVHLFPDPYTFHYDKVNFLNEFIAQKDNFPGGQFRLWGDYGSFFEEYGYKIGFLKAEIITRLYSIWIYSKGLFLSLVVFGGALTWFLIALGIKKIKDNNRSDFTLFSATYFVSWFLFLVFLKTSNYAQLLILSLPAVIIISQGLWGLSEMISQSLTFKRIKTKYTSLAIVVFFLIFISQISWWTIREMTLDYGLKSSLARFAKAESTKPMLNLENVTMTGWSRESNDMFAYYIDRDFIYFHPDTIKKLASQKKLSEVMEKYNISGFVGFDAETSKIIKENVSALKEYKI